MTQEENERRRNDEHVKYITAHLCDKDGDKPYVFISYKSDDWETVLHDIVYRLMTEHGLRVYFDGSFDIHNDLWIKQFPKNMRSYKCKGVLAFMDDKYATSYATLLELMYSQSSKAAKPKPGKPTPGKRVVQVNLGDLTSLSEEEGEQNTGLGIQFYEDGTANENFGSEVALFDKTFDEMVERKVLKRYMYNPEPNAEELLNKQDCSEIVMELLAYLKINKNPYYGPNGDLTGIVGSIQDAFGDEVFDNISDRPPEPVTVSSQDGSDRQEIRVEEKPVVTEPVVVPPTDGEETAPAPKSGRISLNDFCKKYNNSNFKKDTYAQFRLVGTDGYEKYGTEYEQSAYDLSWKFVMKLLAERGIAFIQEVTEKHPNLKFPVFIDQDDYNGRGNDQKKYRQINAPGLGQYYMYRHYGQYDWVYAALRLRLTEFGLPEDKFYFEYVSENGSLPPDPRPAKVDNGGKTRKKEEPVKPGEIVGPVTVGGKKEETVKTVTGRCTLEDFLAKYSNKTFQSPSCKSIKLIGVNGCERYTTDKNAEGKPFQNARQLVFHFAMARIDEMGTTYIETVNNANQDLKNPIFITLEEHKKKKEQGGVSYKAVTSEAGKGYSMCTNYSEYDWIKNSLVKHLRALGLELKDFRLEFE